MEVFSTGSAEEFGDLMGYPEYATDHFNTLLNDGIKPAYYEIINQYYALLDGQISSDELFVLEYTPYVTPEEKFMSSVEHGEQFKDAVDAFLDEYDLPFEITQTEYNSPDSLAHSFDEIWQVEEDEPYFD